MDKQLNQAKGQLISEFPEYEGVYNEFFQNSVRTFMSLKNEFLSGSVEMTSQTGPIRMSTHIDEKALEKPPSLIEMNFSMSFEDIINTNIDAFMLAVDKASDSGIESLVPQILDFLKEVTEESGQVVDAKGQPFSFDHFFELMEKIEITFNEDGSPNMPTLLVNPNMREVIENNPPTKEQERKMEELISRKRDEYFAKKRTRRLY